MPGVPLSSPIWRQKRTSLNRVKLLLTNYLFYAENILTLVFYTNSIDFIWSLRQDYGPSNLSCSPRNWLIRLRI